MIPVCHACQIFDDHTIRLCPLHASAPKLRAALERILTFAFKHEVQYWLDPPGTDAERMGQIVIECRAALDIAPADDRPVRLVPSAHFAGKWDCLGPKGEVVAGPFPTHADALAWATKRGRP